ncbi:MAG TPA: phage tail tape measure protein [Lysobacter sp.]|nr:phage tail tape measure protein [Lysobacter sp.]
MAGSGNLRLQVILSAIDRATGPLRKVMGGSSGAAKALRAAREQLKSLDAMQARMDGFRRLTQETKTSSIALRAAQQRVRQMAEQLGAAEAPSRAAARAYERARAEAERLRQAHMGNLRALKAVRADLTAAGIATSRFREHEQRLRTEIEQANRQIGEQKRRLEALGRAQQRMRKMHGAGMTMAAHGAGAMAAGGVAARGVMAPVAAFAAQEEAAAQLRAAMMHSNGQIHADYARIDALAQRLGNRLPGTTADFYEMFTMLRRQGMSSQVILGGLGEATAYLGAQLRLPYTEAAQFAAKLQDATRSTEAEMMGLADVIQRTFYLGVDHDNMLQGFSKLSPALGTLRMRGLAATNALAPLLVMADQAGMAGEQAGNAYRKVFQYAMDAEKVGKANSLLKPTGIRLDFTDGKGEFGGLNQMFAQLQKLKGLNTQDRLAVIKKLFGDDAETLQVVSLLIDKGKAGYEEVQRKMAAQASLQQRVNSQLGTLKNLWEAATGTATNVLASVGETIEPELKALVQWLGEVTAGFQTWVKENPQLAAVLFKVAAACVALLIGLGAIAVAIGTVLMPFAGLQLVLVKALPLFTSVGKVLGWLAGGVVPKVIGVIRLLSVALFTTPIGWIILGITALAGAAYLIYRNWGPIKTWFLGLWETIKAKASIAWDVVKGMLAWTPLGVIVSNWGRIKEYFAQLWAGIKQYVAGAWDALAGIFTGDGARLRAGLQQMWQAINGILGGWPAKLLQAGIAMIDGLVQGIRTRLGAVKDALASIGNGAIGALKRLLGIHSPSRVFAQLGVYTMQGFAGGIARGQSAPLDRINAFGTRLQHAGAGLALAAAATPAVAVDNRPPVAVAPAAGFAGGAGIHIEAIHIHAAPGMDVQAVAREVRRQLELLERERAAQKRSRLGDYGD